MGKTAGRPLVPATCSVICLQVTATSKDTGVALSSTFGHSSTESPRAALLTLLSSPVAAPVATYNVDSY